MPPFNIPFFLILIVVIELPIKMLIPVIIITTGFIVLSFILVFTKIIENINKNTIVITIDIILPISIFLILIFGPSVFYFV